MQNKVLIPYVSIRPNYLTFYERPEFSYTLSDAQIRNSVNLEDRKHKGKISIKARKRIEQAISWLLETTPRKRFFSKARNKHFYFKVNFITLTLASKQVHSDNTIKKELLNQFLTEIRTQFKVKNYLWRAEAQKNGNIHFHILADKYIHYTEVRAKWNRIQEKLGYIERYTDQTGKTDPPSTEIKSIKHVKNLPRYLSKYCTKESVYRKIEGKQWGLSHSLSKLKSAVIVPSFAMLDELKEIRNIFFDKFKEYDYASCIYVPVKKWKMVINGLLYDQFFKYFESVVNPVPI